MEQVAALQVRTVYGRDTIYPINPTAQTLCKLTKKKTFDEYDLKLIQELGFKIEWITYSLKTFKPLIPHSDERIKNASI